MLARLLVLVAYAVVKVLSTVSTEDNCSAVTLGAFSLYGSVTSAGSVAPEASAGR